MTPSAPRRSCGNRQRGMTLIEMMIALVLGLVIIAAATAVYLSNRQAYRTSNGLGEVQDSARTAYQLLARDIRQAGATGCGDQGRVANLLSAAPNNGGTAWWANLSGNALHGYDAGTTDPAVATGTGTAQRVANTASLQIVGVGATTVTVSPTALALDSFTTNESSSTLRSGDAVVVCDPDHATVVQLSIYTAGSPPTLGFSANGANCSSAMGFVTALTPCSGAQSYQFGVSSQVSALSANDWYIGNNPEGGQSLYRMTLINNAGVLGTAAQEMVRGVTGMSLTYNVAGSATYVDAATIGTNWSQVTTVNIKLTVTSTTPRAGTNGQPVSRTLSALVALRDAP